MACAGCGSEMPLTEKGRHRKWCSESCRKRTLYSDPCPNCGGPMSGNSGRGPKAPKLCITCNGHAQGARVSAKAAEERRAKAETVIRLIREDMTNVEIAEAIGSTPASVGVYINRLKSYGYEIPERTRKGGHNGGRRKP